MKFLIDTMMDKKGQCGRCPLLECNPNTGGFYCAATHVYDPNVEECPLEEYHGVEWHRYPEEKPEEYGRYIVTVQHKGETHLRETLGAFYTRYGWTAHFSVEVIAWAKMPKPYEEESCQQRNIF